MTQSTISIRVDTNLKSRFDSLCESFGLSTSAAFHLFMKTVVRERKIPFEIKADSQDEIREKGKKAFLLMRQQLMGSSISHLSLDEINEEIKTVRNERKSADTCCD